VIIPPQRGFLSGNELGALLDRLPVPDEEFGPDIARLSEVLRAPAEPWPSCSADSAWCPSI
jgi:hypothetical protein